MTTINASPDDLYLAAVETSQLPYTGRQIVSFTEGAETRDMTAALSAMGPMAATSDFAGGAAPFGELGGAASLFYEDLGVALLAPTAQPFAGVTSEDALSAAAANVVASVDAIAAIEPETFVFPAEVVDATRMLAVAAEEAITWGLSATRVPLSQYSGKGIRVAVLDTGFDLGHPDFAGRTIKSCSFIPGQPVHDLHGHGTHCAGTACGPRSPAGVPRYGIAHEAEIFVGKVLSNTGTGTVASILAGMNWAIANRCQIISMSLGGPGGPYAFYAEAARRALAAGCLIVAAAGNESRRPGSIAPTGAPANTPEIVSVAALDRLLVPAYFSCGGKIDIAGPGVDIYSSMPRPRLYGSMMGTSQATPHVAGIAALLAESDANLRGTALRQALDKLALPLRSPASDVGSGLVQAG